MSDANRVEEEALVRRWRAGDLHAAVELLRAHRAELERYLRRRAGTAAEDLLQDIYLVVLRSGSRFRTSDDFRGFVVGLARRFVRAGRERSRCTEATVFEVDGVVAREPNAFALIERRQVAGLIELAVEALPAEQRSCLRLLLGEDRSAAEIAGELGVSLSTVATRLQRAKLRLGVALAELRS